MTPLLRSIWRPLGAGWIQDAPCAGLKIAEGAFEPAEGDTLLLQP